MGRTIATANRIILAEESHFKDFRRALRKADQVAFDDLFRAAKIHSAPISMAAHALPFEAILLAQNLEQQKEIRWLRGEIGALQDKLKRLEELVLPDGYQ